MPNNQLDLPMQVRADAQLLPASVDTEKRTIEVVWSTGAVVRRTDWWTGRKYDESLSLEDGHVDLGRLNNGAPVLDSHDAWDLGGIIGVVERAWIADSNAKSSREGRATLRFSAREEVGTLFRDLCDGIVRNISVGYRVRAFEVDEEPKIPLWRAVDWEPMEISLVAVGADPNAGIRVHGRAAEPCRLIHRANAAHHTENTTMEDTHPAAEAQPAAGTDETIRAAQQDDTASQVIDDQAQRIIAEERARIASIYDAARKLNIDPKVADELVRNGVALADARAAIIEAAAASDRLVETRPHVRMGELDERETARQGLTSAILHRANPDRYELLEPARDWRGLNLIEGAREWLSRRGERVRGLSHMEIAQRAFHTTSDYPIILGAAADRVLRDAYAYAPRTFLPLARRVIAANFKDMERPQMGEAPQLLKVNQHGEFKRGTIGEAVEKYRIATYGRVFGITRQALINDDMDAFTRIPQMFGVSAATLESDTVWAIITGNPLMGDNVNLFNTATHKNLASAGTALDVTNLGKARAAMAKQLGLDGKTILNIRPAFLAVPTSLEVTAEQLLSVNLTPATTGNVVPASIRSLTVISEPRLDPTSGAVPWYLFATPGAIDTIEYAYLDGSEGLYTEQRVGFDIDGVEIKARLDFGAKAIDWRGMYKNPGVTL